MFLSEVVGQMDDLDALLGPSKRDIVYTYSDVVVAPPPPPKDKEEEEDEPEPKKKKKMVRFVGKTAAQASLKQMAGVTSMARPSLVDKEARERRLEDRKRQRDQEEREKLDEEQREQEQAREEALIAAVRVAELMHKKRKQLQEQYFADHAIVHTGMENPEGFNVVVETASTWKDGVNLDLEDERCDLTRYYGSEAFPIAMIVRLATRNFRVPMHQVEIGFVINDCYVRNRRFPNGEYLKPFLASTKVQRMDMGPVHPSRLVTRSRYSEIPVQKFLVFDCDLEDMRDKHHRAYVRRCACKGSARVCPVGCWFYMRVAVKCITYVLKEVFACRTIVPVFSGRRGVHVWVLDERFLTHTEEERTAIIKRVKLVGKPTRYYHPEHGPYMYEFILREPFYANFLDGPRIICAPEVSQVIMEMIAEESPGRVPEMSEEAIEALVRTQMETVPTKAREAWTDFCEIMSQGLVPDFERRFIFRMMYPRLDQDVTTKHHHLVKFPFVVHPVSRRCSIPIPDIDVWTPDQAPRLSELMAYAQDKMDQLEDRDTNPYRWRDPRKRNPLDPYVEHFSKMLTLEYPLIGEFLRYDLEPSSNVTWTHEDHGDDGEN